METEQTNTPQAEGNSVPNPSTQAEVKKDTIPQSRFNEVIGERNQERESNAKLQQQLDKYQADEKAKEEKLLQEKGEFQTILDRKDADLEKAIKKGEMWDNYETARRKTLTEGLPEEKQKFAVSMPLQDLEEFSTLESTTNANAGKTDSSRAGTTAKGEFGGYDSKMEWVTKDPEGYEKAKKNTGGDKFGDMFMPKPNPFA